MLAKAPDAQNAGLPAVRLAGGAAPHRGVPAGVGGTDRAPYIDFARNRIVLPAEIVKAVKDQWVPLDPLLAELLACRATARRCSGSSPKHGPAPDVDGRVRSRCRLAKKAGVRLTMHSLRKGFGCRYAGQGPGSGAAEADASPQHQDHDGLLRQRGRGGEEAVLGPNVTVHVTPSRHDPEAARKNSDAKPLQ